jgi:hypothetical protein
MERLSYVLDDLAEIHSSITALLDSRLISPATRRNLERFLRKLEHEMTKASRVERTQCEQTDEAAGY